jgi:polar amino acid transport system substrate-binding protein
MKRKLLLFMLIGLVLISGTIISAKEYKAAVYQLPTSDTYVNLLKAIAEATGNNFDIQIVPSARGVYMVENKQADFVCPATVSADPKKIPTMKYDYSTASLYKTTFVLYTNKSKPIDVAELKKGNSKNFKIETTASLAELFEFDLLPTTNLEGSLQKVDNGSIDGFIYSQTSGDQLLRKLALKNVKRQLYSKNDLAFGILKGTKGGEVDKMLANGITKTKASGKFDQIMGVLIKSADYIDWQP